MPNSNAEAKTGPFDRLKYLRARAATRDRWFNINNGRPGGRTHHGYIDSQFADIHGSFFDPSAIAYRMGVSVGELTVPQYLTFFEAIGDAVDAYSGSLAPIKAVSGEPPVEFASGTGPSHE
jgi:hypothetical protein